MPEIEPIKKDKFIIIMATKKCKKCGLTMSVESFYKGCKYKDGYRNICKRCWYDARKSCPGYKEKNAKWGKEYYNRHREAILKKLKSRYKFISLHQKKYRAKNRDKIRNKDRIRFHLYYSRIPKSKEWFKQRLCPQCGFLCVGNNFCECKGL